MKRPLFFALVGAAAALTHLTVVALLVEFASWPPAHANVAAFCVAFLVSYMGQRRYTFGSGAPWLRSMARWGAVSVSAFVLNQLMFTQALQHWPGAPYLLLLTVVTILVAALSFLFGKVWAFAGVAR